MEKKILVIDDEELVSKSLIKLLKNNGYFAAIARGGQEAMDMVKKRISICWSAMCGCRRWTAWKRLNKSGLIWKKAGKSPVPEVLITGYVDADKYEKAMDLEVADYLPKPFDNNEFLRVVQKIVG